MADRRFFENAGPFALSVLAEIAEAELAEGSDGSRTFSDVAPLDAAGPDDVSFLDNRRYVDQFRESRAGACIVDPELADRAPEGMALLLTKRPYRGYAKLAQAFYPLPQPRPGLPLCWKGPVTLSTSVSRPSPTIWLTRRWSSCRSTGVHRQEAIRD